MNLLSLFVRTVSGVCLLSLSILPVNAEVPNVSFITPELTQKFDIELGTTRLSHIFNHYQALPEHFGYGLVWLREGQEKTQQAQQLRLLNLLQQQDNLEPWPQLQAQAEQLQITQRLVTPVNMDGVYAAPKDNYLVKDQDTFVVRGKPQHIWIWGALDSPLKLRHHPTEDISSYLKQVDVLSQANLDTVIVIEPNTQVSSAPIAYWNHQNRYISPGSIIYIPLKNQWLSNEYEDINQLFIQRLQSQTLGIN